MKATKATRFCSVFGTLAALIVVGASSARANDGGYTWGMTVRPTPAQQSADVITAGTVEDYGHVGPNWVYVKPWVKVWDPSWAGPSCNTIRYRNGVEDGTQHIGAGAPAPYEWSLDMTPPVRWTVTVTCPLPQGATGTSMIDVTFMSELPPASPSPSASPAPTHSPTPVPTSIPSKPAPTPAPPRPTPKPVVVAPVALVASPVLPVADIKPVVAPTPVPVATPVVTPTPSASPSPAFAVVPRAAVTHSRGFHVTFIEFLGFLVLVAGLLAARWHWAWI